MTHTRTNRLIATAATAVVASAVTFATASVTRDDPSVKVCVGKRNAVVSAKPNGRCPKGANVVRINRVGPAGQSGATGATGAGGVKGDPGERGATGATGADAPRQPSMGELVDRAIVEFQQADDGRRGAHPYAWMAKAVAVRRGWHHPLVATYLEKVYATQNPDGGYGSPEPWDANQDGSVNPADTTYAVTLTDQVGPVFLEGWQHGVVPKAKVEQVIHLVETFPLAEVDGTCVAYSTTPQDAPFCVYNINTSAAYFLRLASEAGFDVDLSRVPTIVARDRSALIDGEWWPYMEGYTRRQDWQHNALMVEAFMTLDPPTGRITLDAMRRATTESVFERMGLLRLTRFDCSLADPKLVSDGLDEYAGDAHYLAIVAWEGALAVEACGP